ncbi:MAG: riboflavin synthase [Planctomycetota bacterium]|jgi:riboflavin synthase
MFTGLIEAIGVVKSARPSAGGLLLTVDLGTIAADAGTGDSIAAMKATDRFGGHFVQGHVDGTATIEAIDRHSEFAEIRFAVGAELLEGMVVKGSVAVDGISLTIAGISRHGFSISVIPETLKRTTLGKAKIGDCLNIETDIIVKAVKKQLENILPKTEPLTAEKLRQLGF